jgi:hypothetical protein
MEPRMDTNKDPLTGYEPAVAKAMAGTHGSTWIRIHLISLNLQRFAV